MIMKLDYLKQKHNWDVRHIERKIYNVYNGYLYHYTSRENLWNIVDSDSFYARHVRFSNDSEEYFIGKREIENEYNKKISNLDDCYMICFCEKNNILSQWREYARGGVSLMMDFREPMLYTIKCNTDTEEKNRVERCKGEKSPYYIPADLYLEELDYYNEYAEPIKVKYVYPGKGALKNDINKINKFNCEEMSKEKFYKTLIPYIKHEGFKEEKEVRLIFEIEKGISHYLIQYIESDGIRKPNIRIEIGDARKKESLSCLIRTYKISDKLLSRIQDNLVDGALGLDHGINVKISFEKISEETLLSQLNGQGKRTSEGYISIGSCKYQQQVFRYIDHFVADENVSRIKPYKIWCEGHLPIRMITVGPSYDQEELRESIEHKIHNIYWMKYVKVVASDIPYRSKK